MLLFVILSAINGQAIKISIFILVFILLTFIAIYRSKKNIKNEENRQTGESYDINVKGDAWWAARFEGLKKDYEDREIYLRNKFEILKSDYESRESFIRGMFEEIKKDLEREKKLTEEKQKEIQKLEKDIQLQNKRIVELELQLLKTLGRLTKNTLNAEELDMLNKLSSIIENDNTES